MVFEIIENYKNSGNITMVISDGYGHSVGFGVYKARLIKQHIKDIDDAIKKYSKSKESEQQ